MNDVKTEKSWRLLVGFNWGLIKVEFEMTRKKIEEEKKPSRKPSNRKKPRKRKPPRNVVEAFQASPQGEFYVLSDRNRQDRQRFSRV